MVVIYSWSIKNYGDYFASFETSHLKEISEEEEEEEKEGEESERKYITTLPVSWQYA